MADFDTKAPRGNPGKELGANSGFDLSTTNHGLDFDPTAPVLDFSVSGDTTYTMRELQGLRVVVDRSSADLTDGLLRLSGQSPRPLVWTVDKFTETRDEVAAARLLGMRSAGPSTDAGVPAGISTQHNVNGDIATEDDLRVTAADLAGDQRPVPNNRFGSSTGFRLPTIAA